MAQDTKATGETGYAVCGTCGAELHKDGQSFVCEIGHRDFVKLPPKPKARTYR